MAVAWEIMMSTYDTVTVDGPMQRPSVAAIYGSRYL